MAEATVPFQVVKQMREEFSPRSILPPAIEAVINGLPGAIAFGDIPPRSSRMQNPENAVEEAMMRKPGMPFAPMMSGVGQEGLQPFPLTRR
jgi:hypothetical protein